jgi:hypothetical protein
VLTPLVLACQRFTKKQRSSMQRLEERAQKAGNPEAITEEQLEQHAALLVATEYDPGPEEPTSQRRRVGMLNLEPRFRGQQRAAAGG